MRECVCACVRECVWAREWVSECVWACGMPNRRAECLAGLRGLWTNAVRNVSTWVSATTGSLPGLFPSHMYPVSFIPLVKRHFFSGSLPNALRSILYTATADPGLVKPQNPFPSSWDALSTIFNVAHQVERFWNLNGTDHKYDHITYSSVFIFHSCARHEQCYNKMVCIWCVRPVFWK
jgi:hypothetical protein